MTEYIKNMYGGKVAAACSCVWFILIFPCFSGAAEIRQAGPPTTTIEGRLWFGYGNRSPITEGYVFALSPDRKRVLGYSRTASSRRSKGIRGGEFAIFGLPSDGSVILVGLHEAYPSMLATKPLDLNGSKIEVPAFSTELITIENSPESVGTPLDILLLAGWVAETVRNVERIEENAKLTELLIRYAHERTLNVINENSLSKFNQTKTEGILGVWVYEGNRGWNVILNFLEDNTLHCVLSRRNEIKSEKYIYSLNGVNLRIYEQRNGDQEFIFRGQCDVFNDSLALSGVVDAFELASKDFRRSSLEQIAKESIGSNADWDASGFKYYLASIKMKMLAENEKSNSLMRIAASKGNPDAIKSLVKGQMSENYLESKTLILNGIKDSSREVDLCRILEFASEYFSQQANPDYPRSLAYSIAFKRIFEERFNSAFNEYFENNVDYDWFNVLALENGRKNHPKDYDMIVRQHLRRPMSSPDFGEQEADRIVRYANYIYERFNGPSSDKIHTTLSESSPFEISDLTIEIKDSSSVKYYSFGHDGKGVYLEVEKNGRISQESSKRNLFQPVKAKISNFTKFSYTQELAGAYVFNVANQELYKLVHLEVSGKSRLVLYEFRDEGFSEVKNFHAGFSEYKPDTVWVKNENSAFRLYDAATDVVPAGEPISPVRVRDLNDGADARLDYQYIESFGKYVVEKNDGREMVFPISSSEGYNIVEFNRYDGPSLHKYIGTGSPISHSDSISGLWLLFDSFENALKFDVSTLDKIINIGYDVVEIIEFSSVSSLSDIEKLNKNNIEKYGFTITNTETEDYKNGIYKTRMGRHSGALSMVENGSVTIFLVSGIDDYGFEKDLDLAYGLKLDQNPRINDDVRRKIKVSMDRLFAESKKSSHDRTDGNVQGTIAPKKPLLKGTSKSDSSSNPAEDAAASIRKLFGQ